MLLNGFLCPGTQALLCGELRADGSIVVLDSSEVADSVSYVDENGVPLDAPLASGRVRDIVEKHGVVHLGR